jgi:hypothetical protein
MSFIRKEDILFHPTPPVADDAPVAYTKASSPYPTETHTL